MTKEATPAMTTHAFERVSDKDEELIEIRECLITGRWDKLTNKSDLPMINELSCVG